MNAWLRGLLLVVAYSVTGAAVCLAAAWGLLTHADQHVRAEITVGLCGVAVIAGAGLGFLAGLTQAVAGIVIETRERKELERMRR